MKKTNVYGVGRTRDKYGNVVKWKLQPYVCCLHTLVGGGSRLQIYVAEEYVQENKRCTDE